MSHKLLQALLLVVGLAAFAFLAGAQEKPDATWRVDANHSVSRIGFGASSDSNTVFAVAQVRGNIHLDSSASPNSSVVFEVFPADPLADADVKPTPSYPTLTFTSHDVRVKPNGRIEAAGELTLTYVERPVTLDATEAYSGPVYSDLVIVHTLTHPVTFELNVPAASLASSKRQLDVSASTAFSTEDFPGVREVLIDSDWPLLAQDEDCQAPSDPNEGYQGTLCTGTAVTAPVSTEMPSTVAEDYHGPDPASVPAGHKILIALDLHLLSDTQNAQHAGN